MIFGSILLFSSALVGTYYLRYRRSGLPGRNIVILQVLLMISGFIFKHFGM